MKPYGIIYKITNKVNGKCYIGQTTKSLSDRWSKHKYKKSHNSEENKNTRIAQYTAARNKKVKENDEDNSNGI